jgi:4-amino-4-deoxy-L-arabinose transferase-like glycosyltransferase
MPDFVMADSDQQQNKMKKNSNMYLTNGKPCIILLALLIPAFLIRYFLTNAQIITNDGLLYIKIAKGIGSGNLQNVTDYGFFNLYSFLIVLFQTVFHNWELSGKMVSVVFGSLTIIPCFFLTRELFNQNVATVSALFYVIHPRFVEYSSDVLREPVFWFFSITALWLAWEGISRKKYFPFILSSLATGFAMFTRLEGALVFLIVILWILWFFLSDKKNRKKGVLCACIFLFSLPVLASPGLILMKNKLNRWEVGLSINKIPQLIIGNNQSLDLEPTLLGQTSGRYQAFFDLSTKHRYTTFLIEILYKFFKSFNAVLFLLFICGIYKRRFIPYSQKDIMVLIWFSVAFIGSYLYLTKTYYLGTRHGLLMAFPALAWAGAGFFEIRERIKKWFGGMELYQKYARFDVLFLIVLMLAVLVPQTILSYRYDKVELKKAGIVLKNMGFSNTTFIVQPTLNRVAFYADAESVPLPDKIDDNALKEIATKHHAKLLIIDERTIDEYVPGIRKIIEQPMFEKLTTSEMDLYSNYSFSIYKIQ